MGHTSSCSVIKPRQLGGFHEKYALEKKLGKGAFAQVYSVTDESDVGEFVEKAVKILDLRGKGEKKEASKLQASAYKEVAVWKSVGENAYIVPIFDCFYDCDFCYMVMEKCSCGLFRHLEQSLELNERLLGDIFVQMLRGISHVHSMRVLHRDIKPDNFMLGGDDGETVKLCDFGLSKALLANGKMDGVYGTAPFMCPEMLKGSEYDERADVWSMGVVAYALLFGDFPYVPIVANSKAMKQAIVDGAPPKYELLGQKRSEPAVKFVSALLDRNPETRPLTEDALNTPFMFASANKCHMLGQDLPSLRPMIYAARKAGAFEVRDISRENCADARLRHMQSKRLVDPLKSSNEPSSNDWATSKSNDWAMSKSNDWAVSKSNDWAIAKSNDWAVSKSNGWAAVKSNGWANASSCSTVASFGSNVTTV